MKTSLLTALLILGIAGISPAAKPGKDKGKPDKEAMKAAAAALKPFDKNDNKIVDGDELAAVKKAFSDAPTGALAVLDKNKDSKLDDGEIQASGGRRAMAALLKEADNDSNHKIEGAEAEALRKKFEADPKGVLSPLDRNGNAKLDDEELAKSNERMAARAASGEKRSKKSTKNTPAPATSPSATDPAKPAAKTEEVKKPETEAK